MCLLQFYWLRRLYADEHRALRREIEIIYRENALKEQFNFDFIQKNTKLNIGGSTSMIIKVDSNQPQIHIKDTALNIITIRRAPDLQTSESTKNDTINIQTGISERRGFTDFRRRENENNQQKLGPIVTKVRVPGDSLIEITTLDSGFKHSLHDAKINLNYTVKKVENDTSFTRGGMLRFSTLNMRVPRFNIQTFEITTENPRWLLLSKIAWQMFFSVLMLAIAITSFVFLYKHLKAQHRLTAIKNDFISNITHELKTPIATVHVAIEALQNFGVASDPVRSKEYLNIGAAELQRLSLLVDKVLKLSMFENKEIALNKENFNLKQIATEVIDTMKLQIDKLHAKVNFECTGTDFLMYADRIHITSVLYNLLDNALKYSKENPEINVAINEFSNYVEITVKDNGIGIAPAYKNKIFDKFFRVPTGNVHNTKGYGLGLSYVNDIIKRHHGFIHVDSQEGIGSSFKIQLPKGEISNTTI